MEENKRAGGTILALSLGLSEGLGAEGGFLNETGFEAAHLVENPSTGGAISVNEPVIIGARSLVQTEGGSL